jgi:Domain of unknown function (DUF397)
MDPVAALRWRTSSHSGSNGGGCLEAASHDSHVLIRDTRDRTGPVLRLSAAAWRRFTGQVKSRQA